MWNTGGKARTDYAGCRSKFEKVDREGLTVRGKHAFDEGWWFFIFKMKISVVWPDLVGRHRRA